MINAAIIKDGIVINITMFQSEEAMNEFPFKEMFGEGVYGVSYADGIPVIIGDVYADGVFSPAPPPKLTHEEMVAEALKKKRDAIYQAVHMLTSGHVAVYVAKEVLGQSNATQKEKIQRVVSYHDALQALDVESDPKNIEWPGYPEDL